MKGFTLIELMIVVAIIAIIAAIAIPNLLESKKTANENAAVATLRSLTSAQEVYAAKWGRYGTTTQLGPKPTGQGLIDGHMASMDATVTTMSKSGYYFSFICVDPWATWCAFACPTGWATTGEKNYVISADGTIRWNTTDSGHAWPGDVSGWKYLGET